MGREERSRAYCAPSDSLNSAPTLIALKARVRAVGGAQGEGASLRD